MFRRIVITHASGMNFHRSTRPVAIRTAPQHARIATRASALWRQRGQPADRDLAIWLDAERAITARLDQPRESISTRLRNSYALPRLARSATSW